MLTFYVGSKTNGAVSAYQKSGGTLAAVTGLVTMIPVNFRNLATINDQVFTLSGDGMGMALAPLDTGLRTYSSGLPFAASARQGMTGVFLAAGTSTIVYAYGTPSARVELFSMPGTTPAKTVADPALWSAWGFKDVAPCTSDGSKVLVSQLPDNQVRQVDMFMSTATAGVHVDNLGQLVWLQGLGHAVAIGQQGGVPTLFSVDAQATTASVFFQNPAVLDSPIALAGTAAGNLVVLNSSGTVVMLNQCGGVVGGPWTVSAPLAPDMVAVSAGPPNHT